MKNKIHIAIFVILFCIQTNNICISKENENGFPPPPPPFEHINDGQKPPHEFAGKRPTKEEMEAKKAEFEKRLNLSDEQKKQIEADKQKDREKIKPIINEMKEIRTQIKNISENSELSKNDKDKMISELNKKLYELKTRADKCRKENMLRFESVLTEKQKAEFEKIKAEQKLEMEKRISDYEKQNKKH